MKDSALMHPWMEYIHVLSSGTLASLAKFLAVVSMQPLTAYLCKFEKQVESLSTSDPRMNCWLLLGV